MGRGQLGSETRQPFELAFREAVLDDQVLAFQVPEVPQALPEAVGVRAIERLVEIPDPPHLSRRLPRPPPTPGQQPEAHGARALHDLAATQAIHWMTSVACIMTCGGMVSESAWAALALITNSKRM